MNLCICSESRKRPGSRFAASIASATFDGLLPSGCKNSGVVSGNEPIHSSGTRPSTINFASSAGVAGLPNKAHYSASKGAVVA